MSVFADQIWYETITPGCCNAPFAMNHNHYLERKKDHKSWWCPNCGSCRHFTGETEEQKKLRQAEAQLQQATREAALARGRLKTVTKQADKMRKRIRNGLCPCCRRNFPSLGEHIRKQHPEFGNNESLRAVRELYGMTQHEAAETIGVNQNHVSSFENSKPIVAYAKQRIEQWLHRQVA